MVGLYRRSVVPDHIWITDHYRTQQIPDTKRKQNQLLEILLAFKLVDIVRRYCIPDDLWAMFTSASERLVEKELTWLDVVCSNYMYNLVESFRCTFYLITSLLMHNYAQAVQPFRSVVTYKVLTAPNCHMSPPIKGFLHNSVWSSTSLETHWHQGISLSLLRFQSCVRGYS